MRERLGPRGDVVVRDHRLRRLPRHPDGFVRLASARQHASMSAEPDRQRAVELSRVLELRRSLVVPTQTDEHVCELTSVERHVA